MRLLSLFILFIFFISLSCTTERKPPKLATERFYPGVISTPDYGENVFSFTQNESILFLTRTQNWDYQTGFLSTKVNGIFQNPIPIKGLDSIYNGAMSPKGDRIIYTQKKEEKELTFLVEKQQTEWSDPIRLSTPSKISGGYFHWYSETELFFYSSMNNGDIVQGELLGNQLDITNPLDGLNTEEGTEFSPYVDPQQRFIIFTRYLEGSPDQQGFFVSYREKGNPNQSWSLPQKLDNLPYGWNAYLTKDKKQFLFTDGEDIIQVPLGSTGLKLP